MRHFCQLTTPIYLENKITLSVMIKRLHSEHWINKRQLEFLLPPTNPKKRIFYLLLKIHKANWCNSNMPSGRPIISDIGSKSYNISKYIDSFLEPLLNKHP